MILLFLFLYLFSFNYVPLVYSKEVNVSKHETPVHEAISFTNYDIYSTSELMSVDNFVNYIDWVYRADGVDLFNISSNWSKQFTFNGNAFFNYSTNLNPNNLETNGTRYMTISYMNFYVEPVVINDANSNYQKFRLDFYDTTNPNKYIRLRFNRVYNAKLGGVYTWYCIGMFQYTSGTIQDYSSELVLIVKNPMSVDNSWSRQFFNFYGLSTDSTGPSSFESGYNTGYNTGYSIGYQTGYDEGLNDNSYNPEMLTIFTGILDIALLPVNVFLTILNFEVFGINIAGFVSSLLTISIVMIIIRFLFGGKKDD